MGNKRIATRQHPLGTRAIGFPGEVLSCRCGVVVRLKMVGQALKPFNAEVPFHAHECQFTRERKRHTKKRRVIIRYQASVKSNPYG